MADCKWIDDEIVELHAMGGIEDGFVSEHLNSCPSCVVRVAEVRLLIETLKRGLQNLQGTSEDREKANDDNSNRQDGS